jgi:hypothetical protein
MTDRQLVLTLETHVNTALFDAVASELTRLKTLGLPVSTGIIRPVVQVRVWRGDDGPLVGVG